MKVLIGILLVTYLAFAIAGCKKSDSNPQISCLPANLQDSLITFYSFGSGSLNDMSGNNYNLINPTSATPGADRAGNANCAFNFTQANGDYLKYINPAFINNFQTIPFSISLWYKPLGTQKGYELLIGRDTSLFHCKDTYGQWSVGLYDARKAVFGINQYSLWQDANGQTNVWKHLVVTCNGTVLKLYINGILTTNISDTGCAVPIPTLNVGDLFIGKGYNGLIDDLIIYKKALSTTEITQLYNLEACCQ